MSALPSSNIKIDHQKWLQLVETHHLRGDDVEEPTAPGGFSEILDAVRQQHLPIDAVAMPIFRANERGKVCSQTSRKDSLWCA